MPDAHKGGGITEEIYHNFHNVIYPGITDYKKRVVVKEAKQGQVYMGLGSYIKTSDPRRDERTLGNAVIQMWDIVTVIALSIFREEIVKAGYEEDVLLVCSIYDSIYLEIRKNAEIIKWVNDTLTEVMERTMFNNQQVPNSANLEIGDSWATHKELKHHATTEEIQAVLEEMK